ncbi:MAG: hypothetical protein E7259_05155 [Lachnospiraceae bacterium]|nr:hypothetical protein [Lachnospiraceae bacterium]
MTKSRKIDILYKKAKGQRYEATPAELRELYPYKVDVREGDFYTTRANITNYVTAVDNGCRLSFYDWCMNNKRADMRRKGSSEVAMTARNNEKFGSAIFVGWLTWGMAIYWIFEAQMSVGACAVIGAVISYFFIRTARKNAGFLIIVLPLALLCIFGSK